MLQYVQNTPNIKSQKHKFFTSGKKLPEHQEEASGGKKAHPVCSYEYKIKTENLDLDCLIVCVLP